MKLTQIFLCCMRTFFVFKPHVVREFQGALKSSSAFWTSKVGRHFPVYSHVAVVGGTVFIGQILKAVEQKLMYTTLFLAL